MFMLFFIPLNIGTYKQDSFGRTIPLNVAYKYMQIRSDFTVSWMRAEGCLKGKHLESFVRKKSTGYEVTTRAATHLMWQNAPSLRAHLLPVRRSSESNDSSYVRKPSETETTERPRWRDELVGDDGSELFAA